MTEQQKTEAEEKDTPLPHGVRYPWKEWFKKGRVTLTKGTDFVGMTHGMIQTVRQAGARLGYRIKVKVDDDGNRLTIHAIAKDNNGRSK